MSTSGVNSGRIKDRVRELRLLIGGSDTDLNNKYGREFFPAPNLLRGIPKGTVIELLGPYRIEWFLQFLKMNPDLRVFWSESEQRILPTAIQQRGGDLRRITFGIFGQEPYQPLRRIVQSGLYQAVLAPNQFTEIRIFKAFQLFTEKAGATLFLLGGKKPSTAWPISLQLDIQLAKLESTAAPQLSQDFKIEILKQKYGLST